MACGTPVIAFNEGSVPEIIEHGKTGFVVNSIDDMIEALEHIDDIEPSECRRHVQNKFSIIKMASKYSALYQQAICDHESIVQLLSTFSLMPVIATRTSEDIMGINA
jgi:glycosyltransferase involved in cell wall biosynthesis